MKKAILTILISVGVLAATATIYPYLNVTMNSGSVTSYPTTDLTLKFENNKLVASNAGIQAGTNNLPDILNMVFGLGSEGQQSVAGDVNGDGEVTSADITVLYNYLLNGDESGIVNGDQDGDGTITSADITSVYNILLGN